MEDNVTIQVPMLCVSLSISPDGTVTPAAVETTDRSGVSTMAVVDHTTQNLNVDSSTSKGRATTLTSGLALVLALTLCLLIAQ